MSGFALYLTQLMLFTILFERLLISPLGDLNVPPSLRYVGFFHIGIVRMYLNAFVF